MITLARLKEDMEFVKDFEGIIDTFKMAALAQFRLFQGKKQHHLGFSVEMEKFSGMLSRDDLTGSGLTIGQKMADAFTAETRAIVFVTSDEGFLGGLNASVIDAGLEYYREEDSLVVLGEKGARHLAGKTARFTAFPGVDEDVGYKHAKLLRAHLLKGYGRRFQEILVVYPEFLSMTAQKVSVVKLLPYIIPSSLEKGHTERLKYTIFEPSGKQVAKAIIKLWIGYRLLEIFISAKQSEFGARIMHLEASLQELGFLRKKLIISYFRQIHALRDKTIREISAAKILLKRK